MTWWLVMPFCYVMARAAAPFGMDRIRLAEYEGYPAWALIAVWWCQGMVVTTPLQFALDIFFDAHGWKH